MAKKVVESVVCEAYAVLRMTTDSSKVWVDISTIDLLREESQRKADETDKKIPHWAKVNPQYITLPVKITVS